MIPWFLSSSFACSSPCLVVGGGGAVGVEESRSRFGPFARACVRPLGRPVLSLVWTAPFELSVVPQGAAVVPSLSHRLSGETDERDRARVDRCRSDFKGQVNARRRKEEGAIDLSMVR